MKLNVIALAGALLALTAAAAQASPATVVPDTLHNIGSGAKQIVNGTGKGIGDQYHHDVAAGRRTVRYARHGTLLRHHHWRRHHHHYGHHHAWTHSHMSGAAAMSDSGAAPSGDMGANTTSQTHKVVHTDNKTSGPNPPASPQL